MAFFKIHHHLEARSSTLSAFLPFGFSRQKGSTNRYVILIELSLFTPLGNFIIMHKRLEDTVAVISKGRPLIKTTSDLGIENPVSRTLICYNALLPKQKTSPVQIQSGSPKNSVSITEGPAFTCFKKISDLRHDAYPRPTHMSNR